MNKNKFLELYDKKQNAKIKYLIGCVPFLFLMFLGILSYLITGNNTAQELPLNTDSLGGKLMNYTILLIPFVILFFGLLLWIVLLHKQKLLEVITARKSYDWRRSAFAFIVWFVLGGILLGIDYFIDPSSYKWQFDGVAFFILFLISIVLIPIQTTFEELFFRGYFMQGMYAFSKNKWTAIIISGVVFGMVHLSNPEIDALGFLFIFYYIFMGLFMAYITVKDGGLELTIGMHFANNLFGALIVGSSESVFQTPTLLYTESIGASAIDLIPMFLSLLLFYFILHKKYHWSFMKK